MIKKSIGIINNSFYYKIQYTFIQLIWLLNCITNLPPIYEDCKFVTFEGENFLGQTIVLIEIIEGLVFL